MVPAIDIRGELDARQQLALLKLPIAKKRRLMRDAAKLLRQRGRDRIKAQKNIDGSPFDPRAPQETKRPARMLRNIAKASVMKQQESADQARIYYPNWLAGRIAAAQQDGEGEWFTADRMQKLHGQPDYTQPATKSQAVALRKAGFRVRTKIGDGSSRWRRPPLSWVQQNMTMGHAGLVLRILRNELEGKRRWWIPLPSRAFLGANDQDRAALRALFETAITAQ